MKREVREMAIEERSIMLQKPHSVILEGRNKLSVSGVEDVERFDDSEISMTTVCGDLIVRGEGLHIEKLSLIRGDIVWRDR
jgi:sporulation protein YabP